LIAWLNLALENFSSHGRGQCGGDRVNFRKSGALGAFKFLRCAKAQFLQLALATGAQFIGLTIGFGAGRGKAADTTPGKVGSASAASAEPPAAPESAAWSSPRRP
jgi:hypothetical protein